MAYRIIRTQRSDDDLVEIFEFLVQSHVMLGSGYDTAVEMASNRLNDIRGQIRQLADAPFQGTLWSDAHEGLRWVTKDRTIYYFEADKQRSEVRILAIFFGGQDHEAIMKKRLLTKH